MNIFLSAFAPENLVLQEDGFDSPAPRQAAYLHTQAKIWCLLYGIPPEFRAGVQ